MFSVVVYEYVVVLHWLSQLAVAQLDLNKRDEELTKERMRVEALKWRVTMDRREHLKEDAVYRAGSQ